MKDKNGIFATKLGMTSLIDSKGDVFAVTAIKLLDNQILSDNNGVKQVLFKMKKVLKKPQVSMLEKQFSVECDRGFIRTMTEVWIPGEGDKVDVAGKSKGKGFQGVMKRYGFKGGRATHGNSLSHRTLGSTGMRQEPGKTYKGRKMAGHMGNVRRTVQGLKIARIMDGGILLIKGAIPGPKNSVVFVKRAVKG